MSNLPDEVLAARAAISKFESNGKLKLGLAQRLVKVSAYWYGHPHGPAAAPRHYERVYDGPHGWQIEFGANRFLVGTAIVRCRKILLDVLDCLESGECVDWNSVNDQLSSAVSGAVANHLDEEYPSFWDVDGGHMHFGTQSVHVPSFIRELLALSRFEPIVGYLSSRT